MYYVSVQGIDECMINVNYYYYEQNTNNSKTADNYNNNLNSDDMNAEKKSEHLPKLH